MKKISFLVLVLTLSFASLTQAATINSIEDLNGKVIGTTNNLTGTITADFLKDLYKQAINVDVKDIVFFDDYMTQYLALESGKVDAVYVFTTEAEYYTKNSNYKLLGHITNYPYNFSMGFAPKYEDLRNQVNTALETLQANGTMDKLTESYITKASSSVSLPAIELANFPGKPTYTMLITGATAPFDMLDSAGEPVGFNIAVLNEISKLLQINFKVMAFNRFESILAIQADKACGQFLVGQSLNFETKVPLLLSNIYGSTPSSSFVVKK